MSKACGKISGLYTGNYGTPQKYLSNIDSYTVWEVDSFQLCCSALMPLRCGMKTKVDCFLGCELVDWLLKVGLAQDRGEALLYGTRLQQGGTLQHIKQEYSFEDGQLHYYFTTWKIQLARSLPQTSHFLVYKANLLSPLMAALITDWCVVVPQMWLQHTFLIKMTTVHCELYGIGLKRGKKTESPQSLYVLPKYTIAAALF